LSNDFNIIFQNNYLSVQVQQLTKQLHTKFILIYKVPTTLEDLGVHSVRAASHLITSPYEGGILRYIKYCRARFIDLVEIG